MRFPKIAHTTNYANPKKILHMNIKIQMLDCTLRDGAYVNDSKFGAPVIKGVIKRMQDAHIDVVECGWLKDSPHKNGSSFFHVPSDLEPYLLERNEHVIYVVMIDWNRYDLNNLPERDGKSIDAIRVVFPHGKHMEGVEVAKKIKEKGYEVFLQAANSLAYSDTDLISLANAVNEVHPLSLSIVDTFGAMYSEDLKRIVEILDRHLDSEIKLGFHSHNNQQLSFALSIQFVEMLCRSERGAVVDSSLCGMGRGAGNTTTELLAEYLNCKHQGNYDMNTILDAIDMYVRPFQDVCEWGYSTNYFIAGVCCTHVNNIAYLLNNHRSSAKDIFSIINSLSPADRINYDYSLLEQKYMEHHSHVANDEIALAELKKALQGRPILLIASGKSINDERDKILAYIAAKKPIVIGVHTFLADYKYDYLFFSNKLRYEYAKEVHHNLFAPVTKIVASNIKATPDDNEIVVNYNTLIKRGWPHFDNSVITCLRLLNKLHIEDVALAGFDGFSHKYVESYADPSLPSLNPDNKWDELNGEIKEMFEDFKKATEHSMEITFLTNSIYNK